MQFTPMGALREGSVRLMTSAQLRDEEARLQAALAKLEALHDELAMRHALLSLGIERLEGLRQTMLTQLDAITPDAELEPQGDEELSLGWPAAMWQIGLGDPTDELEPSLGAGVPRPHDDQRKWNHGCYPDDREEQCDDEGIKDNEDCCSCEDATVGAGEYSLGWSEGETLQQDKPARGSQDFEPSLGASAAIDQRNWVHPQAGGTYARDLDKEWGCEDEGVDTDTEPSQLGLTPTPNWPPAIGIPSRAGRAGFNPHGNVGELVSLNPADLTGERKAVIDAMVEEFDMLALGQPSPFAISLRLASEGLL